MTTQQFATAFACHAKYVYELYIYATINKSRIIWTQRADKVIQLSMNLDYNK